MLGSGPVWSDANLAALNEFFVQNLDYGEGNFMSKLHSQLAPAPPDAKRLAAEMLWFMLLSPSNIGPDNKRQTVFNVWDWSSTERPAIEPWLTDDVLQGVGSGGTAYNTHRWRELVFFIEFMRAFRSLDEPQRARVLQDGWLLAEWMQEVPEADTRQLRHMILFLLFPDNFDRIFGRSDRRRLLLAFTDLSKRQIAKMSALDVSKEIQRVRRRHEEQHQTTELDFYEPPLVDKWKREKNDETTPPAPPHESAFRKATASIRPEHVMQALAEIDRDSYPANARSSTYDLIYDDRRYPPKYVLSVAARHANGEELPREYFSGGKDSQAFKVLKELGFHIEAKRFLEKLVQDFVAQADESSTLVVADYPKEYRGLKVNVSFGKGTFARVPWISFTGHGQSTSEGICPVLLYYRTTGTLVVAYGTSESTHSESRWQGIEDAPTVESHLEEKFGAHPERYGTSLVHQAFDATDELDLEGVEKALDAVIGRFHRQFKNTVEPAQSEPSIPPYDIAEALAELFIEEENLEEMLSLLRLKKNLILQGPPGVGKTFVSKRLAFALMGEKDDDKVGMVQFHQNYAYEDFIQGYRPSGTGFRLKNGIFYEFCEKARNDPGGTYVFIIDEINRGNLSKVFGELMLLIEADKRGPDWAIPLTYSEDVEDRFYIPENVYLIGLMNTADRSLAMVDYALRRRFAFADVPPGFDTEEFRDFLTNRGADPAFVEDLISRFDQLNAKIAGDKTNLGPGYQVGHSYFCSIPEGTNPDWKWYAQIIKTEIAPLLREYYFDDEKQAESLIDELLRPE